MIDSRSTVCIGAGPAGLTAAYILSKKGYPVTVLEKDPVYVGGISRTVRYKDFCFDIGGHRFFSKSREVNALWDEILGDDFLERPRKSRIYYQGRFYPYPLEIVPTLFNLGILESLRCGVSYLKARVVPRQVRSFEDWIINRFGERLYLIFFKTYTEKVWGMKCDSISADWAAQRIRGLSLASAVWHALRPRWLPARNTHAVIKTLIHTFRYPRKGPGMMWEKARDKVKALGGIVVMGAEVTAILREADCWRVTYRDEAGQSQECIAAHVISSMPLAQAALALQPALPEAALQAAQQLRYRDFLIVALVVRERGVFDDNWIYIHDPAVKVGRIQNFKSWSPDMVPDPALNCYGMEYFCFEGDGLWTSADVDLVRLASAELVALGLADARDIIEGCVVRQPKAYPVYDDSYAQNVEIVRTALEKHCPNFYTVGRAGMHKYNNQDHAMMTALLTVKNILAGRMQYDVWDVNQDAEYHEENRADSGARAVPKRV